MKKYDLGVLDNRYEVVLYDGDECEFVIYDAAEIVHESIVEPDYDSDGTIKGSFLGLMRKRAENWVDRI